MTKYKQYVDKMLKDHKEEFEKFSKIHKKYENDQSKWQKQFNSEGEAVLEIIQEYENRLCANTERGMYNKFSAKLSERFKSEIRKIYPMIDHIGIIMEEDGGFRLKKISLL